MKIRSGQSGFTLIEVLAVAALLGVLVTMVMPSLEGAHDKVKDAKLKNDLAVVDQAIQLYKMENGKVPANLGVLKTDKYISGDFKVEGEGESETIAGLTYTASEGTTYTLSGVTTGGETIKSSGSAS